MKQTWFRAESFLVYNWARAYNSFYKTNQLSNDGIEFIFSQITELKFSIKDQILPQIHLDIQEIKIILAIKLNLFLPNQVSVREIYWYLQFYFLFSWVSEVSGIKLELDSKTKHIMIGSNKGGRNVKSGISGTSLLLSFLKKRYILLSVRHKQHLTHGCTDYTGNHSSP